MGQKYEKLINRKTKKLIKNMNECDTKDRHDNGKVIIRRKARKTKIKERI